MGQHQPQNGPHDLAAPRVWQRPDYPSFRQRRTRRYIVHKSSGLCKFLVGLYGGVQLRYRQDPLVVTIPARTDRERAGDLQRHTLLGGGVPSPTAASFTLSPFRRPHPLAVQYRRANNARRLIVQQQAAAAARVEIGNCLRDKNRYCSLTWRWLPTAVVHACTRKPSAMF